MSELTIEGITEALKGLDDVVVKATRNGAFQVGLQFTDKARWRDGSFQYELLGKIRDRLQANGYQHVSISMSRKNDKGDWLYSPGVWVNSTPAPSVQAAATDARLAQMAEQLATLTSLLTKQGVTIPATETPTDTEAPAEEDQPFA